MLNAIQKYISMTITTIYGLLKIVIQPMIIIWNSLKSLEVWIAILHQPLLIVIILWMLSILQDSIFMSGDVFSIIVVIVALLFLWFLENAIVELIYHLLDKSANYNAIQKVQKQFNNYVLLIVSLVSLYLSAFPANNEYINLTLFSVDVLYLISLVCSDAYSALVYEKDSVKELAEEIKKIKNR